MKCFALFLAGCWVVFFLGGCRRDEDPVQPADDILSSDIQTFVLKSPADDRLPAPEVEDRDATDAEREMIKNMIEENKRNPPPFSPGDPCTYWNNATGNLGMKAELPPPSLSRAYALVHAAMYDALVARHHKRRRDLFDNAVIAGAAAKVLLYLFPEDSARVYSGLRIQLQPDHDLSLRLILRSWVLGRRVGELLVEHGKEDGSDAVYKGTPPSGDGFWTGTNPTLPMTGTWKTWFTTSGSEFQPEPPYPFGSHADSVDMQEVYDSSIHTTSEQIDIVHKWADFPPPVIWNRMLSIRIGRDGLSKFQSARAYAYLHAAIYDAFVSCWYTKYTYWVARPFQRIPGLVTVIETPNFPGYTSGHSTISSAAARVMGQLFPSEDRYFIAEAEEAAMSRLLAGIHFRHDNEQGIAVGTAIGNRTVRIMRHDSPKFMLAAGEGSGER